MTRRHCGRAAADEQKLWLVFAGLMLALLLAALDQNIVATALPRIVSDLGAATATSAFFRSLGGAVGVAI